MSELTPSTREAARRLGVSDTAIHKAERAGRIAREPDGQWDIDKTRRRNKIKCLMWEDNGFVLYYKALAEEKFKWPFLNKSPKSLELRW